MYNLKYNLIILGVHMNEFPDIISLFLMDKNYKLINEFHNSGDLVYDVDDKYILKISERKRQLYNEKKMNDYLKDKLPVSKSCLFLSLNKYAYYIKTKVKGEPLCSEKYLKDPLLVVDLLAKALKMFHSIDTTNCELYSYLCFGNTFIHGDLCLPNILIDNNEISGFVDIGDGGVGDEWKDYAWSIWSLEYNLKTDEYTKLYLEKIGVEFNEKKYKYYIGESED